MSIADMAKHVPAVPPEPVYTYYFWHTQFNSKGDKIYSILRCSLPDDFGGTNPTVFTYNTDGSDIRFTTPMFPVWGESGGHTNWHPNGKDIIRHLTMQDGKERFTLNRWDGSVFKILSMDILATGHQSIEPEGRYVITDRYDKIHGKQTVSLRLIDVETDKEVIACTLPTLPRPRGILPHSFRLDGHPAWSRDYKKVSIQAATEGKRQLYVVDLSKLMA